MNAVRDAAVPGSRTPDLIRASVSLHDKKITEFEAVPLQFIAKQFDFVNILKI